MSSFKLKIILVGVPNAGKDELIARFIKKRFAGNFKLTVGVDILTKDVEYRPGEIATLSIWDIGGQRRFEFMRSLFYRGAAGAFLVFDLTREQTYSEIGNWLTEIRNFVGKSIPFILIGNKVQLLNQTDAKIIRKKAGKFARKEGGIYIETSPESVDIVEKAFHELIRRIIYSRCN